MLFTAVGGQTRSALRLSRAFHGCELASPFVWYHSIATTFQAAVPPPSPPPPSHHHHHHHLHARGAAARRGRCASCPTGTRSRRRCTKRLVLRAAGGRARQRPRPARRLPRPRQRRGGRGSTGPARGRAVRRARVPTSAGASLTRVVYPNHPTDASQRRAPLEAALPSLPPVQAALPATSYYKSPPP